MAKLRYVPGLLMVGLLLVACGPEAWERDPALQAAKKECDGDYACIEQRAVQGLDPDICRLAGIYIDDMCLQAVYEAANDPAICDRIYLRGVVPNCRAYYESRTRRYEGVPAPTVGP